MDERVYELPITGKIGVSHHKCVKQQSQRKSSKVEANAPPLMTSSVFAMDNQTGASRNSLAPTPIIPVVPTALSV